MANARLTDKTALEEQVGSGDLLMVVDVNDTTGSSAGTSKKMDFKYVIQTDKISLSNAEAQALDSTPKTLVGALSGYMINVYSVIMLVTYASSTEFSSNDLYAGYDNSLNTSYYKYMRDFMYSKTTSQTFTLMADNPNGGVCSTSILNKPFMLWSSGAFNGGWSAEVYVTYAYTKVL